MPLAHYIRVSCYPNLLRWGREDSLFQLVQGPRRGLGCVISPLQLDMEGEGAHSATKIWDFQLFSEMTL